MFLGSDYLDGQRSTSSLQDDKQDGVGHFVDPSQLVYDPTSLTKNRPLRISTNGLSSNDLDYNSPSAAYPHASETGMGNFDAIDPQLLMSESHLLSGARTPAEEWRQPDAHGLGHHISDDVGAGPFDFTDSGAGPAYGFLSTQSPSQSLASHYGGPNDGTYAPFLYQHPAGNMQYMTDPFLYATQPQPAEETYASRAMNTTSGQVAYSQQLREINPNNSDAYDDHEASSSRKKARPEKIRTAKPLRLSDLEHDDSRFAKVVRAFVAIEDETRRTVPEIARSVERLNPGRYPDSESVKRMVNDVLQKHKAFWHPGRGSPYHLNLQEGRARREFPSNAKGSSHDRHGNEDENVPPYMGQYGSRRQTRYSRRQRDHVMQHNAPEDTGVMSMGDFIHPIGDSLQFQHNEQYMR